MASSTESRGVKGKEKGEFTSVRTSTEFAEVSSDLARLSDHAHVAEYLDKEVLPELKDRLKKAYQKKLATFNGK